MTGLKNMLMAEKQKLEKILQMTEKRLQQAPAGSLRLSRSQNCIQYYHCMEGEKNGKYISKKKEELIRMLAQKTYDEKVLQLAEKRIIQLDKFLKDYADDEIAMVYEKEHAERKKLIQPVEVSLKQQLREWKEISYLGKEFQEGVPVIMSERGERVRSKSEKIIADYFFRHGIEYKYECPLYLKGVGNVYPDFTLFSLKTGQEIYWEHNGRMDDPVYARKFVRKMQSYESNDIFPGDRLILTYETEQTVLSTASIERLAARYLI